MTRKEFDVLVLLAEVKTSLSQRDISSATGHSLGMVNKVLSSLYDLGYLKDKEVTDMGRCELEKHQVKRAVFMAAGFGSRLMPITLNTPKPLVRVKGCRLIDTMLDAIIAVGINEIYIVRGYLKEQFDQLLYKYPNIKFIDNLEFNETNNISSALQACEFIKNAYVMDADLYLKNPGIITKYQYDSNYLGIPVSVTDDWCMKTKNGKITSISIGGEQCHKWVGVSYWTEEDGKKLAEDIHTVYDTPGGKEKYWDQVPLECCKKSYQVSLRECNDSDIVEIDTFQELLQLDKSYNIYT